MQRNGSHCNNREGPTLGVDEVDMCGVVDMSMLVVQNCHYSHVSRELPYLLMLMQTKGGVNLEMG